MHVTGKYANGLMNLSIEDEEEVRKREIPFQDTYFDVVLGDLILKREDEKIFKLKIFDPTGLKVNSVQVEVTKSDANELEATVTDILTKKYRIDRQGQIKQIQFVELHIRAYLTDAEDAQNISYLNTADGLTWMVKSKKSFPNVYKVAQAQIQVKWKDVPLEEFDFEDNRQKVVKKTSAKGKYEVILEIVKITPASKGIEAPIVDEKFGSFLKDTEYIQPSDTTIQQQLAEIQGNEKDAFTIVQNILRWISDNISTDIIAETLTGPEVLKKRRGKCSEYAILFASLARAAGIPAKVVLGEANSGNQWIGHMWNEVWLGEWMAVDAATGIFVTGPSHVKFVDSPTVMGTQRVRMKLVDNLSLEILDFTEEEIVTSAEIKTGIFGHTYFNKAFTCKISAPDTTWVIDETVEAGHTSVTIKPKEEENVTFALVLFAVPPGMSAKAILNG
ncbi:MAG: transglutaminase-like domain-containing protein, partial [Candidatus Zixiibacteriota bacterium]